MPGLITADRLTLRRWEQKHLDALMAAIAVSLGELRPWMPWAQLMPTRESEQAVLERSRVRFDAGQEFNYFLFEVDTNELVGFAGLEPKLAGTAEIGYWVRSDRHRSGYATEAASALTTTAFEFFADIAVVEIRMDKANVASAGVPRKLGYRISGEEEFLTDRATWLPGQSGQGWIWQTDRETWKTSHA